MSSSRKMSFTVFTIEINVKLCIKEKRLNAKLYFREKKTHLIFFPWSIWSAAPLLGSNFLYFSNSHSYFRSIVLLSPPFLIITTYLSKNLSTRPVWIPEYRLSLKPIFVFLVPLYSTFPPLRQSCIPSSQIRLIFLLPSSGAACTLIIQLIYCRKVTFQQLILPRLFL